MDDGSLFMLILFVFWVLSGILNAAQKKPAPEDREDGEPVRPAPERAGDVSAPPPGVSTERWGAESSEGMVPSELWAEIEALARGEAATREPPTRRQEPRRQAGQERQPQRQPERPAGAPTQVPAPVEVGTPRPTPPSPAPQAPWRTVEAGAEAPVGRERPPDEARASTRWTAASRAEELAGKAEKVAARAEAQLARAQADERSLERELEDRLARQARQERRRLRDQTLSAGARATGAPAADGPSRAAQALADASPEELRRIVVLREVLGPPVALRDEGPAGSDPF